MRIRKSRSRQLTREDTVRFLTGTVREAVGSHTMDLTMDEREAIEIIEEMGYDYDNHIAHMENQVAINDALAGYPDLVTYEVIESAVKKEMANRANRPPAPPLDPDRLQYAMDPEPMIRVESKITKRQLRRIIRKNIPTRRRSTRMTDFLFEENDDEGGDDKAASTESTGDPGKDLAAAYAAGPEGVRAFMDAQGNKDPKVQNILVKASEADDGADPDDKINIGSATAVPVSGLGPTQQFIDLMQSVSFPLGSADVLEQAITSKTSGAPGAISISGGAVLDGHHRWSGVYAITPDGSITSKDFAFPGGVAEKLAAAQLAIAAVNDSGTQPSKGGGAATDIIGKGKDEIVSMIDANKGNQTDEKAPGPLLNDKMIQAIADGKHSAIDEWAGLTGGEEFVALTDSEAGFANDPIRKAIAEKVGANLGSLPQPLGGAPESREDMPQLDHESIGGDAGLAKIEKGLPAGEFNVVPPFTKEAVSKDDNLMLDRWQRLAGLIKG